MKLPRTSLGSIGFAIAICAIDFAVIRAAFADDGVDELQFVLLLLPMIDLVLIRLYRLRKPGRRTAGAIGFCLAGSIATGVVLTTSFVAGVEVYALLQATGRPLVMPIINALTRSFGNAAMKTWPMQLTLEMTFELLLPTVLFCLPPLAVACLGGWLGRRYGPVRSTPDNVRPELAAASGPPIVMEPAC